MTLRVRTVFLALLGWSCSMASPPSGPPQESQADWNFLAAGLGKWAPSDLVSALDTATTRQGLERFLHGGPHFLHMGPFARCPYEVDVDQGTQCVEIDAGNRGTSDPYLVRWDSATGKGTILHEAWELVPMPHSKSMTERHVGPDSVGWLRPGTADGRRHVDVVFRKDSVRMVTGESLDRMVARRFLAGRWMPVSPDSARPFTFFGNGRLGGFRLSEFYRMTPEQKADSATYGGYKYGFRTGRDSSDLILVQNALYDSLCLLRWSRRHDTLHLSTLPEPGEHPDSVAWCNFLRKSDVPPAPVGEDEDLGESATFDSLRHAAFLPANIPLDTVIRCLLGLEAARLARPGTTFEDSARFTASRTACLLADTGAARLTDQVPEKDGEFLIRSRDSSWIARQTRIGNAGFATRYVFRGPPSFRWMSWKRHDAAFHKAFDFLEPIQGARWQRRHEDSYYRFEAKNHSCFLHGKFEEGITLESSCLDYPKPKKTSRGKSLRK